jgi:hypothetical protein
MFKLTAHPQVYWDLCGVPLWIWEEWAIMIFIQFHNVFIHKIIFKLDYIAYTMFKLCNKNICYIHKVQVGMELCLFN